MKKSLSFILPLLLLCTCTAVGKAAFADEDDVGGGHTINAGTMAGIRHGKQGDPVLPSIHRFGQINAIAEKPGHALGSGDLTGGLLKAVTHEKVGEPTHQVTPRPLSADLEEEEAGSENE